MNRLLPRFDALWNGGWFGTALGLSIASFRQGDLGFVLFFGAIGLTHVLTEYRGPIGRRLQAWHSWVERNRPR